MARTRPLIGATFGLLYVLVNAGALGAAATVLRVIAVIAYAGLLVVALRAPAPRLDGAQHAGTGGFTRGYWFIVAAEVIALFAGNALLAGPLERPQAVLPWVTTVVGVHFLALARVWHAASIGWLGGALALCGAFGLVLAWSTEATAWIAAVAGVLPGAILLAGSWWAVASGRRQHQEA